jgi:hypothetical protein
LSVMLKRVGAGAAHQAVKRIPVEDLHGHT